MAGYRKEEVLKKLNGVSENLYRENIVNYRGRTNDTEEYYTEVIAEWLVDSKNKKVILEPEIETITREKSYKTETHTGEQTNSESNREEEILAIELFNQFKNMEDEVIGKMLDYQTPLKNKQTDDAGKIDLLSFSKDNDMLFLLELKRKSNEETLLRCILEIVTYYHILDIGKLSEDFSVDGVKIEAPIVVCAPIVIKNSTQYKEYEELKNGDRPQLRKLIEQLNSKINLQLLYIEESNPYSISKFEL